MMMVMVMTMMVVMVIVGGHLDAVGGSGIFLNERIRWVSKLNLSSSISKLGSIDLFEATLYTKIMCFKVSNLIMNILPLINNVKILFSSLGKS